MESDLAKYIYEKMLEETKNYQWRIVFDSQKHALEIYFIVAIEAEEGQYVQDINGDVNRSQQLQFEEVICFYDEKVQRILPSNYLYALPFDPAVGIEQIIVDALLKQLNIHIANARSDLHEFLLDDNQQNFSMTWNEANMNNTVKTLRETGRYSTNILTFSMKEDTSLVDQFKEENNVGLERI